VRGVVRQESGGDAHIVDAHQTAHAFALALSSRVSNSGNPRGWKETIPSR
jgi:hypothetical protein